MILSVTKEFSVKKYWIKVERVEKLWKQTGQRAANLSTLLFPLNPCSISGHSPTTTAVSSHNHQPSEEKHVVIYIQVKFHLSLPQLDCLSTSTFSFSFVYAYVFWL